MLSKSLVTGATGFVGRNLIGKLLAGNEEVHVIARNIEKAWRLKDLMGDICIHNIDLRNENAITELAKEIKVNKVYHLAAYGGYHYQKDLNSIIDMNLLSTWILLREFSKYELELFINTSSSSEYGEKFEPMHEKMLLEPNNMYGAAKASSTILCNTFARINKIPFVTLRLFSPYGYYDSPTRLIPAIIISKLLNRKIVLNKKTSHRDYLFIDDIIAAYLSVSSLENPFGEVLNVGSGIQYTVEEIFNIVSDLIDLHLYPEVIWGYDEERQYEPEMWVSCIDKAKNLMNWHPSVSIEDGLKMTIEWFKENINLYK